MWQHKTICILGISLLTLAAGCGNDTVAPPAPAVTAAGPDLAPPTVPLGLAASGALGHVKLAWKANTIDTDLAGYRVYREAFGVTKLLAELDATTIRWVDQQPQAGSCRYAVTAVDEAGNESAWISVHYTTEWVLPDLEQGT